MEINELYLEIRRRGPILLEAFDDDYMICCDGKISSTPTYLLDRYFSKEARWGIIYCNSQETVPSY
jgi:hypothetical protein